MSALLNAIILWLVVIGLCSLIIYSIAKVIFIIRRYKKKIRDSHKAIQEVLDQKD